MKKSFRNYCAQAALIVFCVFANVVFAKENNAMNLKLESSDFGHMGEIPKRFTCDGDDVSPALTWSGLPEDTQSLALIVDDPDAPDPAAPKLVWVHWVLYNIPPSEKGLPGALKELPAGAMPGLNDWQKTG